MFISIQIDKKETEGVFYQVPHFQAVLGILFSPWFLLSLEKTWEITIKLRWFRKGFSCRGWQAKMRI